MKFKTDEAQAAYMEILESVSKHVAEMYEQMDQDVVNGYMKHKDLMVARLGAEEFRQNGLCRAIQVATSVDTQWASVKGGLSLAAMQHGAK